MAEEINSLTVRVLGDITDLRKKMSKAERTIEQFGYNMTRLGKSLTVGLSLPLAAAGTAATKLAADAAEAANKFDVVFGPSAARARARLEELHATIPLTRHEMEGLSASLQDMLVPMGLARGEAADLSVQFLELAGDIASFNNISAEDALAAIRSGLAGESEPLRRFGVDVRAARLEALALSEGLIKTGETLDRTARAQAVFRAITQDSADAVGDAARTADEAANSFRFFLRNVKELAVNIGNVLLPVVTPLVNKLNETLTSLGGLSDPTVRWAVAIGAVTAAVGPLLFVLGKLVQLSVTLKPAIVGLAATLGVGTGGLALVVGGAVTALGLLAAKFVATKLEAAALAGEVRGLNAQLDRAAEGIRKMTNEQAAGRLLEVFKRIEAVQLNINIREALGDPEADIVPWRLELGRLQRELKLLQGRLVETADAATEAGSAAADAANGIAASGDAAATAARKVRSLADAYRAAFGAAPARFTPFPSETTFDRYGRRGAPPPSAGPSVGTVLGAAASAAPGPLGGLLSSASSITAAFSSGGPLIGGITLAGEAFDKLSSLFSSGQSTIQRFIRSLQRATEVLRVEFEVLDIDSPVERFNRLLETTLAELPDFLRHWLEGVTPENLEDRFREFLDAMPSEDLQKIRPDLWAAWQEILKTFAELGALEDQIGRLNDSFRVLNAPSGFGASWWRDRIASGGAGGSALGGIQDALNGLGGGIVINGGIHLDGDRAPREMWEDFREALRYGSRSGDPLGRNLDLGPA